MFIWCPSSDVDVSSKLNHETVSASLSAKATTSSDVFLAEFLIYIYIYIYIFIIKIVHKVHIHNTYKYTCTHMYTYKEPIHRLSDSITIPRESAVSLVILRGDWWWHFGCHNPHSPVVCYVQVQASSWHVVICTGCLSRSFHLRRRYSATCVDRDLTTHSATCRKTVSSCPCIS